MAPLPIAHRGWWWPEPKHQNNSSAFWGAVKAGYGIELDVRLWQGKDLVIQHGPRDSTVQFLDAELTTFFAAPLLAWNLKELAAAEPLTAFIRKHDLGEKSVIFDLELAAREAGMPPHHGARVFERFQGSGLLARASDRQDEHLGLALIGPGMGVWLDAFEKDWVTEQTIRTVHAAQKAAYVVSPELHGRPLDLGLWKEWVGAGAQGICTDFPHLLAAWLNGKAPLEPVDPWWGP
jgi:hypothetical protein